MWQRVISDKRILGTLTILVVLAAIPLTLQLAQKQQDVRQRAAEDTPPVCSETGTDTILIIDKSNSMNNPSSISDPQTRFQRAKQAAKNFADILAQKNALLPEEKKHKLAVVSFSDSVKTNQDAGLTTDMVLVKSRIDAITPGDSQTGWTCIECGVKKANAEFQSGRERNSLSNFVILLTDGKANWLDGGTSSVSQTLAEQKALEAVMSGYNTRQISYFTIGLGAQLEISETFLKKVATQTNAKYFYAPTATELQGIYSQISQVLGKGSVSGFVYNDSNANTSFDTNEQKLSGWNLQLIQNTNTISSTTTDTNGNYTFSNICDGSYQVKLSLQTGWNQTSPSNGSPLAVTLTSGSTLTNNNLGVKQEPLKTTLTCSPTSLHGLTRFDVQTFLKDGNGNPISGKDIDYAVTSGEDLIEITRRDTGANTDLNGSVWFIYTLREKPEAEFHGEMKFFFAGNATHQESSCTVPVEYIPEETKARFEVFLHGIGNAGDNANPTNSSLSNKQPVHTTRQIDITIYDANNQLIANSSSPVDFNSQSGSFPGIHQLGSGFPTGKYSVLVSSPGYLTRKIPRIVTITNAGEVDLGKIHLVSGDVDLNNALNILDYDLIIGCYTDYAPPESCTTADRNSTDINDDGTVNQFDYNLFLRELSVQFGDTIIPEE